MTVPAPRWFSRGAHPDPDSLSEVGSLSLTADVRELVTRSEEAAQ